MLAVESLRRNIVVHLYLSIQLTGKKEVHQFSDRTVLKDDKLTLVNMVDNLQSEYLISDFTGLHSDQNAEYVFSIIDKITSYEKDSFFITGTIINNIHNVLLCFQDIKRYRGKLSGPILHINRSEVGNDVSLDFYIRNGNSILVLNDIKVFGKTLMK